MRMSCVWRIRWPLLRRGLCAFVLGGLGWALYAWLPPQPRWVVRGPIAALGLAPDGKTFRTATMAVDGLPNRLMSPFSHVQPKNVGPVEFWDVETGRHVLSVIGEGGPHWGVALSDDGTRLAAIGTRTADDLHEELRCIDLATGREKHVAVEPPIVDWHLSFSPHNNLLLLRDWKNLEAPEHLFLYDADSLQLVAKIVTAHDRATTQWSKDGTALLLYAADDGKGASVRRIGRQGDAVIRCEGAGDWLAISPDGKLLATAPARIGDDDIAPIDSILLWELDTGKPRGTIPINAFHPRSASDNALFLSDNKTLILTHGTPRPGDMVGAWDAETGQCLGEVRVEPYRVLFFPEQNAFAARGPKGQGRLDWQRARPFGTLWQRDWPGKELHWLEFLGGPNRLLAMTGDDPETRNRLYLLDVETGATRMEAALDPKDQCHWLVSGTRLALNQWHYGDRAKPSPFRQFVEERIMGAFHAPDPRQDRTPTTTRVLDIETGAELCRIAIAGADLCGFAADGQSLFFYQEAGNSGEATLSCYDVPPRVYSVWIIGVPLAVALLLIGLRASWRWARRRRAARNPVADAARLAKGAPP